MLRMISLLGCLLILTVSIVALSANFTNLFALDRTGLVLYLPLDEGSGKVAEDISGNGNDGNLEGGAEWVEGHDGKGVRLDSAGDRILVQDSPSLDIEQDITMELWAMVDGLPDGSCAFFMKPTAYMFHTTTGGGGVKVDPLVFIGGNYGAWPTPANAIDSMGEWHHWATTYDGTEYQIYIDGELAAGYERSPGGPIDQDDNPLALVRDNRSGMEGRNMPCTIDSPRIWNRALSAREIKEAMTDTFMAIEPSGKLATTWAKIKK